MLKKIRVDDSNQRLLIILIAFFFIACISKPGAFLNLPNFQTMGRQVAEYGLMAIGCGLCLISGGIDLSMVYVANLTGIIAGLMMQRMGGGTASILLAVLSGLLVGILCGLFNGCLVAWIKIPAMLATLGSYQLFMGISIVLSGGSTVSGIPAEFVAISRQNLAGIPVPFLIFLAIVILLVAVLGRTIYFERLCCTGTNLKAANFSGIRTKRVLMTTYMLSGLLSSIAGLLSLARINSAKADFGSSYTMQCILVAVMGGVNPDGGFGKVSGIALAVLILQMMTSYLNTFPTISNYYRDLIWGVALIGIMILNRALDKRKGKAR